MSLNKKIFKENISLLLAQRNKNFLWLSKEAGISLNCSYQIKNENTSMRMETMEKIAKVFQIPLSNLLKKNFVKTHTSST